MLKSRRVFLLGTVAAPERAHFEAQALDGSSPGLRVIKKRMKMTRQSSPLHQFTNSKLVDVWVLQGYLAHENHPPRRTLQ